MQLQEHGLVMNHERRGMFVTQLGEEDVQRISSLRIVLEAEALKICRARISKKDAARLTSIMEQMEAWTEGSEMDAAALDLQFHRTLWKPRAIRTSRSRSTRWSRPCSHTRRSNG